MRSVWLFVLLLLVNVAKGQSLDSLIFNLQYPQNNGTYEAGDTLQYSLTYRADIPTNLLLFIGDPDYCQISHIHNGRKEMYLAGKYISRYQLTQKDRVFIPVHADIGLHTFEIKSYSKYLTWHYTKPAILPNVSEEAALKKFEENTHLPRLISMGSMLIFIVVGLFAAINAALLKNPDYRNYAVYAFSLVMYFLVMHDWYSQWHLLFPEHPDSYMYISDMSRAFLYILYLFFIDNFLELKNYNRSAHRVLKTYQWVLVGIGVFMAGVLYFTHNLKTVNAASAVYAITTVFIVVLFVKILRTPLSYLKYYILGGGVIITLSSFAELLVTRFTTVTFYRSYYHHTWHGVMGFNLMQMGMALEMLIFLLAISLKSRDTAREKEELQNLTMSQLRENERLQNEVKDLLKKQLDQSQIQLQQEMEISERKSNEADLLRAQLKSLQLQMNPHYLFNSLNAVDNFILGHKPREASEFLGKYAQLMRSMLRNSEQLFLSLAEELDFAENYLSLERIRFENRFDYKIEVSDGTDINQLKIPGMLLQPILENAIWHGLSQKKGGGLVKVLIKKASENGLQIIIEDNGRGLQNYSKEEISLPKALQMIRNKLELISRLYGAGFVMNMEDAEPGVRVIFDLSIKP